MNFFISAVLRMAAATLAGFSLAGPAHSASEPPTNAAGRHMAAPAATRSATPSGEVTELIARAKAHQSRNENEAALERLNEALGVDPGNEEARRMRGDLYFRLGELDKAMADFAELRHPAAANSARPRAPAAPTPSTEWVGAIRERFGEANAALHKGDLDRALDLYNRILAAEIPNHYASRATSNRGNIYDAKGDREAAMRDYEQAIRLDPTNPGAYINRATMLHARGEFEAAIKDYNEAIRFDPKRPLPFYNRGLAFRKLDRPDEAKRDMEEAIRLAPQYADAHVMLGLLAVNERDVKTARAALESARRIDPGLAGPWIGLARLDEQAGRWAAATVKLERAITLNPNDPGPRNMAAWMYATAPVAGARNGKKAVSHAVRACELTAWASFAYVDTLAAAYAEVNEFTTAADFQWFALSLIESDDPTRPEAEARLARYQRQQKYRDTSRSQDPAGDHRTKPRKALPSPTPQPSQLRGGPVGSSSRPLRPSGDPAGFPPSRVQSSSSALRSCCR